MKLDHLPVALVTSASFALLGILLFVITFWLINKLTPFSISREIEHDQNTALAILIASMILGVALIVSASISG
jgi:uncharacterized membrane protein YjfL (UPF0719 family)